MMGFAIACEDARKRPYGRSTHLTTWIRQKLKPRGGGASEAQHHAAAGSRAQPMLGSLSLDRGAERVGEDQAGVVWKNLKRHVQRGGKKQTIAMGAVFRPFLVGAIILDR